MKVPSNTHAADGAGVALAPRLMPDVDMQLDVTEESDGSFGSGDRRLLRRPS